MRGWILFAAALMLVASSSCVFAQCPGGRCGVQYQWQQPGVYQIPVSMAVVADPPVAVPSPQPPIIVSPQYSTAAPKTAQKQSTKEALSPDCARCVCQVSALQTEPIGSCSANACRGRPRIIGRIFRWRR